MKTKSNHFNFLWEKIIQPSIQFCLSEASEEFKQCSFVCNSDKKYKDKIEQLYKEKREWLKGLYLHNKMKEDKTAARLDMHKIAAVLCRCIVGCKYFIFDEAKVYNCAQKIDSSVKLNWLINNAYINYKLAYLVGMGVTFFGLLHSLLERKNGVIIIKENYKDLFMKLVEKKELSLYDTNVSHGDFKTSMIIMLMKNDINNRNFDYLALSTIFYQIQEYNKLLYKLNS